MLDGLTPEYAPRLLIAVVGVAVAFVLLIIALMFLKRRNSPLFVKGGRTREHRLLVMDAAAVDAKRRLVLIRRDDTEHLIMIGGPSDIVIETGIRKHETEGAVPAAVDTRVSTDAPLQTRDGRIRADAVRQAGAQQQSNIQNRPVRADRSSHAPVSTPVAERQSITPADAKGVSAMGSVLYDEDREPMSGQDAQSGEQTIITAAGTTAASMPADMSSAEQILDQARSRVLAAAPSQRETASSDENAVRLLEARLEASKAEAARAEQARLEAERAQAARREAEAAQAARQQAEQQEAARQEAARQDAIRAETARRQAEQAEAARKEAERIETERAEAARIEEERQEAARLEAERQDALRAEAARREAAEAEAARRQAEREQAERAEREQVERAEAQRRLAEQAEAERQEAARLDMQQQEAKRAEAARLEAERIAAARTEALARYEASRRAQSVEGRYAETEAATQTSESGETESEEAESTTPDPGEEEVAADDQRQQQRLASDFEQLLEAELEAGGILDVRAEPVAQAAYRSTFADMPTVEPETRDGGPISGARPGSSIEQDMARRLGEISLKKNTEG